MTFSLGAGMASNAHDSHFAALMVDANTLAAARTLLWTTVGGRGHNAAVSRALVVACVSAWESYIEELVREAMALLRPVAPPLGTWPSLNASVRGMLGRFNTPNTDQIRQLFSDSIGLIEIQQAWTWPSVTAAEAREQLREVMEYRHQIAHGVNPRPAVDIQFVRNLPQLFLRLARCTDDRVRRHLATDLGVSDPWPE